MQRTAPGLRTDTTARLAELERQRPEWRIWLELLREVERSVASHESRVMSRRSVASHEPRDATSPDTPLLHGCTLEVDGAELQRRIRRLATTASALERGTSLRQYRPSTGEALRLVGAAVMQDGEEIAAVAAAQGLDPDALSSVSHLAALPLLRSSGRVLQEQISQHWQLGYCPVCAAWPVLAERRGLDRSRRLRCGRCAAEWEVQWLCCIYCGEREHERLGSLQPDDRGEMLKVETCATCGGYLKSLASLQGFPAFELLLQDLETVEFDLVALDRGYCRPLTSGFALEIEIADHASG
jgi:FdhE protein